MHVINTLTIWAGYMGYYMLMESNNPKRIGGIENLFRFIFIILLFLIISPVIQHCDWALFVVGIIK